MKDEDLLIRPRARWHERIRWQTWISVISFVVSLSSALFTWQLVRVGDRQAKAAEHQATTADQSLRDAKQASTDQKGDVERARIAAESSARAAQKLADGMDRSARAAEVSANAGREALSLNRRSLILGNEPDIQILDSRLSKALTPNEKPIVTIRIFNAGKGRALKLENRGWIFVMPKHIFQYGEISPAPSITDLASGFNSFLQLALELPFPLTSDLIANIDGGKLTFYVYGISEYYDNTLDKQRKYTLHWCNFYDATKADKLALSVCREHNYSIVE